MQPRVGAPPQASASEALNVISADDSSARASFEPGWKSRATRSRARDLELFADEGESAATRTGAARQGSRIEPIAYESPVAPSFAAVALLAALFTMASPAFDSPQPLPLPSGPVVQSTKDTPPEQTSPKGQGTQPPASASGEDRFAFSLPATAHNKAPSTIESPAPADSEPAEASHPVRPQSPQPAITPRNVAAATVSSVVDLSSRPQPQPPAVALATLESLPVGTVGRAVVAPQPTASAAPDRAVAAAERIVPDPPKAASYSAPVDETAGIRVVLKRYADAYTALDAGAVRDVWPTVDDGALGRAFEGLVAQTVRLDDCRIDVSGARAQAVCAGTASWLPRIGGGKARETHRTWTFALAQRDRRWAIVSAEMR